MDDDAVKIVIATIASGASLSDAIDLEDYKSISIIIPAWTTANLTFQSASESAGLYQDIYDDAGTEVNVTAAGTRVIVLGTVTKNLTACRFLKIRSGTSGTPVNQGSKRELKVILKK